MECISAKMNDWPRKKTMINVVFTMSSISFIHIMLDNPISSGEPEIPVLPTPSPQWLAVCRLVYG